MRKQFYALICVAVALLLLVSCNREVERNIKLLSSEDTNVRLKAIVKLEKTGNDRAIEPLTTIAVNEKDDLVIRVQAIFALAKFGDKRTIFALDPLAEGDSLVKNDARAAVILINNRDADADSLMAILRNENKEVRRIAVSWLRFINRSKAKVISERLAKEDADPIVRGQARVLFFLIERDVDSLLTALKHSNTDIRNSAAVALGEIGGKQAVEPLIAALKNEADSGGQFTISRALAQIGKPAIKPLIELLKEDKEGRFSFPIHDALKNIGKTAINPLITVLENENIIVRGSAAEILGEIGDKRGVDAAIERMLKDLRDKDNEVRRGAVRVLREIGDKRTAAVIEPLIDALKDEDSKVRGIAAMAFGDFVYRGVRVSEVEPAVEPLIELLKDVNSVRLDAVYALGQIGDKRAVEPLITVLRAIDLAKSFDKNKDSFIRRRIAVALGKIGDKRGVDAAVKAMLEDLEDESPDVRYWAVDTLGEIGDKRAISALERVARQDEGFATFSKNVRFPVSSEARTVIEKLRQQP